jgi:hypothetical protein
VRICKAPCLQPPTKQKYAIFLLQSVSMHLNIASHKNRAKSIWARPLMARMNVNQQSGRMHPITAHKMLFCVCILCMKWGLCQCWRCSLELENSNDLHVLCTQSRVYGDEARNMAQCSHKENSIQILHTRSCFSIHLDGKQRHVCMQPVRQLSNAKCL